MNAEYALSRCLFFTRVTTIVAVFFFLVKPRRLVMQRRIAVLFVMCIGASVSADEFRWTGGGGNDIWGNGANWTSVSSGYPGVGDSVRIDNANGTIDDPVIVSDQWAEGVEIAYRDTTNSDGVLSLQNGSVLTVGEAFTVGYRGSGTGIFHHISGDLLSQKTTVSEGFATTNTVGVYNHHIGIHSTEELLIGEAHSHGGTYNVLSDSASILTDWRINVGTNGGTSGEFATGLLNIAVGGALITTSWYNQNVLGALAFAADSDSVSTIFVSETSHPSGDGLVSLDGILEVDLSAYTSNAYEIVLIDNDGIDPIQGVFDSVSITGSGLYTLSYTGGDGNDLTLVSSVPAPSSFGAAAVLMILLGIQRKRSH